MPNHPQLKARKLIVHSTPVGTVYLSFKPTKRDKVGRDGLYVDRVEMKPFKEWPLRDRLRYVWNMIRRKR